MPFISFHAGGCWAPDAPWHKGEQAAVAEVSTLLAGSGERWCRLQHLLRPPWCSLGGLVLSPCLLRACFGSHREPGARPGQQTWRGKPWTMLRRTGFIVLRAQLKIICQCWDFFSPITYTHFQLGSCEIPSSPGGRCLLQEQHHFAVEFWPFAHRGAHAGRHWYLCLGL